MLKQILPFLFVFSAMAGPMPQSYSRISGNGLTPTSNLSLGNDKILVGNASGIASQVTMSSEATMSNTGAVTLTNASVIGKVLTGYSSATGTVSSTDTILTAINKLNGNEAALSASAITALTGDITASGPGSVSSTLATVNTNIGSFGSSTAIPNFTVTGKGLITAAGSSAVVAPAGTLTGTTLASGVVTSSLTAVGTIATGTWNATAIAGSKVTPTFTANVLSQAGASTGSALKTIGNIFQSYATSGNVALTGETDLFTTTVLAATLGTNGDRLVLESGGGLANNANTKTIKIYYGSNSMTVYSGTNANQNWWFRISIGRISSSSERISGIYQSSNGTGNTVFDTTIATATGSDQTVKITGAGTADSDLNAKFFSVNYEP